MARAYGELFERLLEVSCSYYRRFGVADIQKTPEPMKVIEPINRSKGVFKAVFEKQAQPDFKGVLKGGQMILFEAKRTQASSIPKKRVSDEQAANFSSAEKLGATCFIVVSFNERRFFRVPWNVWNSMEVVFKKKSVNEKDLEKYEIPFENGMIQFLKLNNEVPM